MAVVFYIQTEYDFGKLNRTNLEIALDRILNRWAPVANFTGDKSGIKILFVDDQTSHSIKIIIPFLNSRDEEKGDLSFEDYANFFLGQPLLRLSCRLESIICYPDGYTLPADDEAGCYGYNLNFRPKHPLYSVVKEETSLLKEIDRIRSQIGSHTNSAVMSMIKLELNSLIVRYNILLKNSQASRLKNLAALKEKFADARKKYQDQKNLLEKETKLNKIKLNKIAGNPVEHLPADSLTQVFCFLTLQEMRSVLFLISHGWTAHAELAITDHLVSKISPANRNHGEFKEPKIDLVRRLYSDLQKNALRKSTLHLDVATHLTTFGFERFHYHTRTDILKHPNEVNELMARDPRYCFFFAKLVTCIQDPTESTVEWAYREQEKIAKLLERAPGFHLIALSAQLTENSVLVIVNNADELLSDLDKIGVKLDDFLKNCELLTLFLKGLIDVPHPAGIIPADPQPWMDYVEQHAVPEKTASPAP